MEVFGHKFFFNCNNNARVRIDRNTTEMKNNLRCSTLILRKKVRNRERVCVWMCVCVCESVNFINVIRARFSYKRRFGNFFLRTFNIHVIR
jgi:hypothetical protein